MKDRIFIAWSGSNDIALKVQNLLKSNYDYECIVGGNSDNNSKRTSVGDTILDQLNMCNQAIVILKNRADGNVSNNLFFELGYALAAYGQTKVHCVKPESEVITLPSDFDNSFIHPVAGSNLDDTAQAIVNYFLGRQKLSVDTNKMYLIDNRYIMHDLIQRHNSAEGPKCSDYELAQYILFYMQAANIFGDVANVREEMIKFRQTCKHNMSDELELAVNLSLSYFDLVLAIKSTEDSILYIDEDDYFASRRRYEPIIRSINDSANSGIFYDWLRIFVTDHVCYYDSLYSHFPELFEEDRKDVADDTLKWSAICLKHINNLKNYEQTKQNRDYKGILSLLTAYLYRNDFLAYNILGQEDKAFESLKLSLNERITLKESFSYSTDTHLIENLDMEYYLALTECLTYADKLQLSRLDKKMYLSDIKKYLKNIKDSLSRNKYVEKIEYIYKKIEGGQ